MDLGESHEGKTVAESREGMIGFPGLFIIEGLRVEREECKIIESRVGKRSEELEMKECGTEESTIE